MIQAYLSLQVGLAMTSMNILSAKTLPVRHQFSQFCTFKPLTRPKCFFIRSGNRKCKGIVTTWARLFSPMRVVCNSVANCRRMGPGACGYSLIHPVPSAAFQRWPLALPALYTNARPDRRFGWNSPGGWRFCRCPVGTGFAAAPAARRWLASGLR